MLYPTRSKAIDIVIDAEKLNPGLWVKHSFLVAECAEKIAKACELNSDKAYILGLLHDIGRRFGTSHFGHIVDGYRYMSSLNYDEVARICLTHSFNTHYIDDYIGNIDVSKSEFNEFKEKLETIKFDDYDRLIQLCDSLCGTEIMNMKDRMDDVKKRYGNYPENKRVASLELKSYFEKLSKKISMLSFQIMRNYGDCNIYRVFLIYVLNLILS